MGLGKRDQRAISWEKVEEHNYKSKERWLVIDNGVYDITRWQDRHPGGRKLLRNHSGQDVTVS